MEEATNGEAFSSITNKNKSFFINKNNHQNLTYAKLDGGWMA